MENSKRKQYTPQEKVIILKKQLLEGIPLSILCDEHGIHPSMFNRWKKCFFENGHRAFESADDSKSQKTIRILEEKLVRKNEVLSELMEAYVGVKKNFGEI